MYISFTQSVIIHYDKYHMNDRIHGTNEIETKRI